MAAQTSRLSVSWAIVALLFCSYFKFSTSQITHPSEVDALKTIRARLVDPMSRLRNWNTGDPCRSNWTGVNCYNTTLNDGYLHVKELRLFRMNLSGTLAPELGRLSRLNILDFMWNNINGSIPEDIGNITSLVLLLLNGNQLTGSLPEKLGYLPKLDRIQIDQNQISGPIPRSYAYLNSTKHFHMNNNSISGQIPPELSRLPNLVHLLLDNNNLSGDLPPQLSQMPNLRIIQLDNNNFSGSSIPASYGTMNKLLKLSLRNCGLQGSVPDFSRIPKLLYLDLSYNQLSGPIPSGKLSSYITTIDLSNNRLAGQIPSNFSELPSLQLLSLGHNQLNGSVPTNIWKGVNLIGNNSLILDFQNNALANLSDTLSPPANVSILLYGNPVCLNANQLRINQFCQAEIIINQTSRVSDVKLNCDQSCPSKEYEIVRLSSQQCYCAIPFGIGYRLKSPGFSDFLPYYLDFHEYLSSGLDLLPYQLKVESFIWERGPRLRMFLKFFPEAPSSNFNTSREVKASRESNASRESDPNGEFNTSEVQRIGDMFAGWRLPDSDIFGPFELLNFTLGHYGDEPVSKSGLSVGAIVGIVVGAVVVASTLAVVATFLVMRRLPKYHRQSKRRVSSRIPIKISGVRDFTFQDMAQATNDFSISTQIGRGGYGSVYRGILADGSVVAIKRAQAGSLQGSKEFYNEIEFLSRLHHRNLVSLVGYCNDEDEQLLVYEYMPNGTLRDHLSANSKEPLNFDMRLWIALGAARGILYLHTEADPPVFHRDVKASNILLDSKFVAKVADFGLSRLAPAPDLEGALPDHVSTVVKGTPGYLDPEYFLTHQLTDKSDVYSLGVVFLELLTGMQPIQDGKNIVREVAAVNQSGRMYSVIDNRIGSCPSECIEKFMELSLRCCRDETDARPSMYEVVRELENIWRIMTPDIESTPSPESMFDAVYPGKLHNPSSSSSSVATSSLFSSSDVSGSNLLSSVMPNRYT